jgi:hypothetical protein
MLRCFHLVEAMGLSLFANGFLAHRTPSDSVSPAQERIYLTVTKRKLFHHGNKEEKRKIFIAIILITKISLRHDEEQFSPVEMLRNILESSSASQSGRHHQTARINPKMDHGFLGAGREKIARSISAETELL